MEDRLITIAIHTYDKAVVLRSLLESEGVKCVLQNVNLVEPVVSSGVRVRINERDLPLALRIIESCDLVCPPSATAPSGSPDSKGSEKPQPMVLAPVDCSLRAIPAVKTAFHLAHINGARITLLHSFLAPDQMPEGPNPMDNVLTFEEQVEETKEELSTEKTAGKLLDEFCSKVRSLIASGEIPPVPFDALLEDGLPEETINLVARDQKPLCIVMGTKVINPRERELLGSVTAEVLDTVRSPMVTVPEPAEDTASGQCSLCGSELKAIFFASLDQTDILAIDYVCRLLHTLSLNVTIVPAPRKRAVQAATEKSLDTLAGYCRKNYPESTWSIGNTVTSIDDIRQLIAGCSPQTIILSNKKRNMIARLFNPTLPHRLLFDIPLPLVVVPV